MAEYIEREKAIDELRQYIVDPKKAISDHPDDIEKFNDGIDTAISVLSTLPTADVQPVKHGKWKLLGEPPWYVRECSECGGKWHHWHEYELPRYCNNCGATMDGEENGRLH